jgi:hypothetical protein
MTPLGIENANFRLVAQCFNQMCHHLPPQVVKVKEMILSPFILRHTKGSFSHSYSQMHRTISIKTIRKELALYTWCGNYEQICHGLKHTIGFLEEILLSYSRFNKRKLQITGELSSLINPYNLQSTYFNLREITYRCAGVQVCRCAVCADVQVCRCAGVQVCMTGYHSFLFVLQNPGINCQYFCHTIPLKISEVLSIRQTMTSFMYYYYYLLD